MSLLGSEVQGPGGKQPLAVHLLASQSGCSVGQRRNKGEGDEQDERKARNNDGALDADISDGPWLAVLRLGAGGGDRVIDSLTQHEVED